MARLPGRQGDAVAVQFVLVQVFDAEGAAAVAAVARGGAFGLGGLGIVLRQGRSGVFGHSPHLTPIAGRL